MKNFIKVLSIFLVVTFGIIQFFKPEKNNIEPDSNHLFNQAELPGEIQAIFKNACLDCHSNQTNYLWYHKIAPVSWMINNHIVEGKKELNLSEWGQMSKMDKISKLDKICSEVEHEKMPIKAYVFMHKNAKLSEEQVASLCVWTEKMSEEILTAK